MTDDSDASMLVPPPDRSDKAGSRLDWRQREIIRAPTDELGSRSSSFGSVRSLQRGLAVLQAVNQHNGLTSSQVARSAGIPRPTAYRLLETLEGLGFVVKGASDETWRPTLLTKSLGSGYREEDWGAQIAAPKMAKLGKEVLWPIDLVTFRDYAMEVRASTHGTSPFSLDHGMVGRRLPVLETSGGRAHLAFCSKIERDQILEGLRKKRGITGEICLPDGWLSKILRRCRSLRVGYRSTGFNSRTMSISAPIMKDGRPISCLTMIWIASALDFEKAIELYSDALISTADEISEELSGLEMPSSVL